MTVRVSQMLGVLENIFHRKCEDVIGDSRKLY